MFLDKAGAMVSDLREHAVYILVYEPERNHTRSLMDEDPRETPCSLKYIADTVAGKANSNIIMFGLEPYRSLYYKNVFTYTASEFEGWLREQ